MRAAQLVSIFYIVTVLLFAKVFISILLGYADYLPPNFRSGFLLGREDYFYGLYQFAFYSHLIVGPLSLIVGTILFFSGHGRLKFKGLNHRKLGKFQAALVLLGVVPSGFIMASPHYIGWLAGSGLLALSIATAGAMLIVVRCAMKSDFANHQIWATRCYLLLLSPLILRVFNGTLTQLDLANDVLLAMTTWSTWIVPLLIYESARHGAAEWLEKRTILKGIS